MNLRKILFGSALVVVGLSSSVFGDDNLRTKGFVNPLPQICREAKPEKVEAVPRRFPSYRTDYSGNRCVVTAQQVSYEGDQATLHFSAECEGDSVMAIPNLCYWECTSAFCLFYHLK